MTFPVTSPYPLFTDRTGAPLDSGYIYIGVANQNPQTNPITVYWDAAGTIPATQPLRTSGGYIYRNGTPANIFAGASCSVTVRDRSGALVYTTREIVFGTAASIGFTQAGAGATSQTLEEKIRRGVPFEPQDWMTPAQKADVAAGTMLLDVTVPVKAFFDACIAASHFGHIPAGGYLVDEGELVFDNGHVETAWPHITTDGHDAVIFKGADAADAPIITISNGDAVSGAGKFWLGGSLGGITFETANTGVGTTRHGLQLRGIWNCAFGWMCGNDLRGSTVYCDQKLFGGNNPDPYSVGQCTFEGIEGNRNKGRVFYNNNYVGFSGCHIGTIRAIECLQGVFYGVGSAVIVDFFSVGSCAGWAIDDGTNVDATGGPAFRFTVETAELDDVENGIRINRQTLFDYKQIRFNHRYDFSALNTSNSYWPRIAIDLCGGASSAAYMGNISAVHRIEAGGVKGDLGVFVEGNNTGNAVGINIDQYIIDNAGFGFVDTDYYANLASGNNALRLTKQGAPIYIKTISPSAVFRGGTGTALTVGSNPITSGVAGTPTFTLTSTAHGLVANQCVTIQGATDTDSIPAAQINRSHSITSIPDANTILCTVETNCVTGGVAGGGAGVSARKDQSFLNITGFGTAKCIVAFQTEMYDRAGNASPTLYEYTVPYPGTYKFYARVSVTGLSAGARVRLAAYKNIHTTPAALAVHDHRCQGANRESVELYCMDTFVAGDKVSINADQNTAVAVAPSIVAAMDISWGIEPLVQ